MRHAATVRICLATLAILLPDKQALAQGTTVDEGGQKIVAKRYCVPSPAHVICVGGTPASTSVTWNLSYTSPPCHKTFLADPSSGVAGIAYVGDPVLYTTFIWSDPPYTVYPITGTYKYEVTDVATGVLEFTSSTWVPASGDAAIIYPTPGLKRFTQWFLTPTGPQYRGYADILVIPAVQRIWVDGQPICTSDYVQGAPGSKYGQPYCFKLKANPSIDQVWRSESPYITGSGGTPCPTAEKLEIQNLAVIAHPGGGSFVCNAASFNGGAENVQHLKGSARGASGFAVPTLSQLEERCIPWSELSKYVLPTGAHYGQPITLELTYYDYFDVGISKTATIPVLSTPTSAGTYHANDVTITGNTTWTPSSNPYGTAGPIRLSGKLRIVPDAMLTVKDLRVEFGPNGSYEVDANSPYAGVYGGRLKLDNSIFTGLSCNGEAEHLWRGGTVNGCTSCDQTAYPTSGGIKFRQGLLQLVNGSEISYALTGSRAGRWPGDPDINISGGGIIQGSNSRWRNNKQGVVFIPYSCQGTPNPPPGAKTTATPACPSISYFNNCDFTYTKDLTAAFQDFIWGQDVRGVKVRGSRFKFLKVVGSNPVEPTGTGIRGYNFGVSIDKITPGMAGYASTIFNEFQNFQTGVAAHTSAGLTAVSVKNSYFSNSRTGVEFAACEAPVAQKNEFLIPRPPTASPLSNGIGNYLLASSLYTVAENRFGVFGGYPRSRQIGVLAWNTGTADNVVERNGYVDVWWGNFGAYINRGSLSGTPVGLQFRCSDYRGVQWDQIASGGTPAVDGIRTNQGSASLPAGNVFNNGTGHIQDAVNGTGLLNYNYYYQAGVPLAFPDQTVGSISKISTPNDPQCSTIGTGPSEGVDVNLWPADPTKLPTSFPSGPVMLRFVQNLHTDSLPPNRDSLYHYAGLMGTPYGDLMIADLLFEDGKYPAMDSVYNAIGAKYGIAGPERVEFDHWGRRLFDVYKSIGTTNRFLHQINAA